MRGWWWFVDVFGSLENKRKAGVLLAIWVDLWGGIINYGDWVHGGVDFDLEWLLGLIFVFLDFVWLLRKSKESWGKFC